MKRTKFDETRDQRIADTVNDNRDLMCRAHSCPRRWSVRMEGKMPLCSAHAWAEEHQWPRITEELIAHDLALAASVKTTHPPEAVRSDPERLAAALERLRTEKPEHLAWARRLRERELAFDGVMESGLRMTQAQKEAWRVALEGRAEQSDDAKLHAQDELQRTAERVQEYMRNHG